MVTDEQVCLLRRKRMAGMTIEAAAAAAGMCERTAREWQSGPLPSACKGARHWRTRGDPFAEVWACEVVPLLEADADGGLEAKTVFAELCRLHPGVFEPGQLRTLQRRIRDWRAVNGSEQEVIFPQDHVPGRMGAIDFTDCRELQVTLCGVAFSHLLFHFVLAWSGWHWVQVAYSETFEALVSGLQGALWALGGVPVMLRMDNMSAATHELRVTGGRSFTKRFQAVLDHYDLRGSRIEPGESHQNGVAEKGHDLLKSALDQELRLRGSRDFESVEAWGQFVNAVIEKHFHQPRAARQAEERRVLRALPSSRIPDYTRFTVQVRRWSTVEIARRIYSVPSRLIGHEVEVRQYAERLEVRYKGRLVETLPRLRGDSPHRVDYRHVIWSLVRKPGAFACYRFREDLFPTLVFRRAYDALRQGRGERADVEYVRILHLAAASGEAAVGRALDTLLAEPGRLDYATVKALVQPEQVEVPDVHIAAPDFAEYDALLVSGAEA
jgi:hypothetical protein